MPNFEPYSLVGLYVSSFIVYVTFKRPFHLFSNLNAFTFNRCDNTDMILVFHLALSLPNICKGILCFTFTKTHCLFELLFCVASKTILNTEIHHENHMNGKNVICFLFKLIQNPAKRFKCLMNNSLFEIKIKKPASKCFTKTDWSVSYSHEIHSNGILFYFFDIFFVIWQI